MPYNKYIKVKSRPNSSNRHGGIDASDKYHDNDEKTVHSVNGLSDYMDNETKTINPENMRHFVAVINAQSRESFVAECHAAEQLYHSHKSEHLNEGQVANDAYHFIFSVKGQPDPELVFRAGIEIATALAGSEYAAKICTHLNTDNYHDHILINAYSNDGTKKFKDEWHLYKKVRAISDEISLKYGFEMMLDTKKNKSDKKDWAEYLEGKRDYKTVKSTNTAIKKDIRECANAAEDYGDYIRRMEARGYHIVQSVGRTAYIKDGSAASDYSLGGLYSRSGIEEIIDRNNEKKRQRIIAKQMRDAGIRTPGGHPYTARVRVPYYDDSGHRIPMLIRLLIFIVKCIERGMDEYYDKAAADAFPDNIKTQDAARKLKRLDETIALCEKYGIRTVAGLNDKLKQCGMDGKIADNKAMELYAVTDQMEDAVALLKNADYFQTAMDSLGLDESMFPIKKASDADIRRAYAALDPMTGKQKKQLWNALNEKKYRLADGGFDMLSRTDADEILEFLNSQDENKDTPPHPKLKTEEQYNYDKALRILQKRLDKRLANQEKSYGMTPATSKQTYALRRCGYGRMDGMDKATAMRILNQYMSSPVPNLKYSSITDDNPAAAKWQTDALKDFAIIDQEFKGIDLAKLDEKTANNLINYGYAKLDKQTHDIDDIIADFKERKQKPKGKDANADIPKQEPAPAIDYNSYTSEEQECILEYKRLLDIKNQFGLDTDEKVSAFIQRHDKTLQEADVYAAKSRECREAYKDLNYVNATIKNCRSKSFAFGARYNGDDAAFKEQLKEIDDAAMYDRLIELQAGITRSIDRLSDTPLTSTSIVDLAYEPAPPEIRDLLTELATFLPEYFPDSESIARYNPADAYAALTVIDSSHKIEKLIKKYEVEEAKNVEENAEDITKNTENNIEETAGNSEDIKDEKSEKKNEVEVDNAREDASKAQQEDEEHSEQRKKDGRVI